MAHVIAICGSGGKTTLCKFIADELVKLNKKVCITTTTHMWKDFDVSSIYELSNIKSDKVYFFGKIDNQKIEAVSGDEYSLICEKFDYVIVEADGSKSMPMKIPYHEDDKLEPVIPHNANDIIIVVGKESLGREIGHICHRFDTYFKKDRFLNDIKVDKDTIVDEKIIDDFVNHYYYEPLKKRFPKANIYIYKNDFSYYIDRSKIKYIDKFDARNIFQNLVKKKKEDILISKLAIILCASGFSKRFGDENKLFISGIDGFEDKKLYQIMIDKIIDAKEKLQDKFIKEHKKDDLEITICVVTQYDDIINDDKYNNKVQIIKNDEAIKGLSSSVKLAVRKYKDYDAMVFINADLPNLKVNELTNFIYNSILNESDISSMYVDTSKNPAYFEKMYFDEILDIEGDIGPKELLKKYQKKLYKYYISNNNLIDIDTKEDLKNILKWRGST